MVRKIQLMALFILMLFASPAFAAITVTWSTPTSGISYANTPLNRQTIDANFGFTDNNTDAGNDLDFNLFVRQQGSSWAFSTLFSDQNIYDANVNPTATVTCHVKQPEGVSGSCSINWTMPLNTEMPDGYYCLDVNVTENRALVAGGTTYSADKNATTCFYINNGFGQAATTRGILLPFGIILVAGLIIVSVLSIAVLKTDPAKTALATVVAGLVIAVILMVFGTITGMI